MLAAFGGVNIGGMAGGLGGMSRWEWCGAQTAALAQQYGSAAPNGLSVVLFSTGTKIFPNVKVQEIPKIFTESDQAVSRTKLQPFVKLSVIILVART